MNGVIRRQPIAVQVMLLVALTTLLASGAMMAIALLGPPMRVPPHDVDELLPILAGMDRPRRDQQLRVMDQPPLAEPGMLRDVRLERELAVIAQRAPTDFLAFVEDRRRGRDGKLFDGFVIGQRQADGRWVVLHDDDDFATLRWQVVTIATISAVTLAVMLLAWLLVRPIVDPIRRLGQAAADGRAGAPLLLDIPDGPPEVRAAAISLADLTTRNHDHAQRQLFMLGAIAHDIGTPLARLAFRLERLPDAQREVAMDEIDTIRALIADSLTLAKGYSGPLARVEMARLVHDLVQREQNAGRPVDLLQCDPLIVAGDARALERMLQNLVENALRYGQEARVSLRQQGEQAVLEVADRGPGFPPLATQDLLKPYVTGEASRNAAMAGSGLGLAIVAQVVDRHQGTIALDNPPGGGARVQITLPLQSG